MKKVACFLISLLVLNLGVEADSITDYCFEYESSNYTGCVSEQKKYGYYLTAISLMAQDMGVANPLERCVSPDNARYYICVKGLVQKELEKLKRK
ncbi:MAG TPA: hypothetical protein V6C96_02010 [Vampirovibrionales bacterium]